MAFYVSYSLYLRISANIMHTYFSTAIWWYIRKQIFRTVNLAKPAYLLLFQPCGPYPLRVPAYMFLEKSAECYMQIEV